MDFRPFSPKKWPLCELYLRKNSLIPPVRTLATALCAPVALYPLKGGASREVCQSNSEFAILEDHEHDDHDENATIEERRTTYMPL